MKKLTQILTPIFLLAGLACFAQPLRAQNPQVAVLDGDWNFTYVPTQQTQEIKGQKVPDVPDDKEFVTQMPVPAVWDDHLDRLKPYPFWSNAKFNPNYRSISFPMGDSPPDASLLYLIGTGWYRKAFDVPSGWKSGLATLHVGGVRTEAWVWLNGNFVGYHLGNSTPFEMSLERWVRAGQGNELVIAVSNTRGDRGGFSLHGYQGRAGGIYRSTYLKFSGAARVKSCYLRPQKGLQGILWNVEVEGAGPNTVLDWKIRQPRTRLVLGSGTAAATASDVHWETGTFGMLPWSDHAPNLYAIELTLRQGDVVQDQHRQPYGLRLLEPAGTDLRLNGRPIMLRGGTDQYYFPLTTVAPLDVESYRDRIRKMQAIGFNWIRFHTWVPSEEFMQAADELGMMLQVSAPNGFGKQEWIDILSTCRKHPSVVLYNPGNEEMLDEAKIDFLKKLSTLLRTYVPDGLFDPQEAMRGVEYRMNSKDTLGSDVTEQPFPYNPTRLASLREMSDVFGAYMRGQLSYNSVEGEWRKLDEQMAIYRRPVLSHELGILGNYLNLDLEDRYIGARIGPDLYAAVRHDLAAAGLLDRAQLYYRNSCKWTSLLRKQNLETARKAKYIAGYDFLGPFDQNSHRTGYPCGILNEFFELKPGESAADVLRYNGESVLLLDYTNHRNFTAGDRFRFDLLSSLYGASPLEEGTLRWRLATESGEILNRGEWPLHGIRNGQIDKLGTIDWVLPPQSGPSKITLFVQLSGGEYELANDWDFWVFPKASPVRIDAGADANVLRKLGGTYPDLHAINAAQNQNIRVVSGIQEDTLDFLVRGGTVVLLGPGPLPSLPTSFQMSQTGRVGGNLATVIGDHPLMQCFPHDGYCDWQFYSMLQGKSGRDEYVGYPLSSGPEVASAVDFSKLDVPFDPIIEVVSSFKLVHKQANLFEWRVGQGRLLVCTMSLDVSDPAAAYLLNSMFTYVQGNQFSPRTKVQANVLEQFVKAGPSAH
jgi:hypothetical protein